MELLNLLAEILKYVAPAACVLVAVKFVMDSQSEKDRTQRDEVLQAKWLKQWMPLRIAAHERAILFLERIRPDQLVMRLGVAGKNAAFLHMELLLNIRDEFEHNLVQQLYLNTNGWNALVQAKEELLAVVNQVFKEGAEDEEALVYARRLLEKTAVLPGSPIQNAINVLKSEFQAWAKIG
jgi:hypothetical protein